MKENVTVYRRSEKAIGNLYGDRPFERVGRYTVDVVRDIQRSSSTVGRSSATSDGKALQNGSDVRLLFPQRADIHLDDRVELGGRYLRAVLIEHARGIRGIRGHIAVELERWA